MARKPYIPLNQKPECEVVPEKKQCDLRDRNVRAMVSADHGNSIQQRPDGLYAPAIVYRENTVVESDGNGISVQESQSEEGFRKFDVGVRISLANGNILQVNEDGLFVSVETEETNPILLTQGTLSYTPLVPGEGTISYEGDRNVIRVLNGLTRIVLPLAEEFERMEELYLVQDGQRTSPMHLVWPEGVTVDNVAGPGSRTFGAGSSVHLLRHMGQEWLVLSGGGVDEAPFDGRPYTRKDGIWVQQHSQVLPALVLGEPDDPMPLDVSRSQFNQIVLINDNFTQLDLKRQYLGNYQDDFEATFVKNGAFLLYVPMGVRVNGFNGPLGFNIEAKPKGCVLKKLSDDNWLLLGSVQQDGSVEPLPPITTLEFPGSGTFNAVVRLMDGTRLYDMTGNTNMMSSVHALKNLIISAIVIDEMNPYLDMKDLVYQDSFKTGLTQVSSLVQGDTVSYRDLLSLLLMQSSEDIAVMISTLLGEGDHAVFTQKMNVFIAELETPLVSSFYGAATVIADPVGVSNTYKVADWLQHIEENYEVIRELLRQETRDFTVFGPNSRTETAVNNNQYLVWNRVDYGKTNDLPTSGAYPFWGITAKAEYPVGIPVYISMQQFSTEVERHYGFTSALMSIEDDFPFLTDGEMDFDLNFSNVTLLLGNSINLVDRSNIQNQVFRSSTGFTQENRDNKGWIRSYALNGETGYITVYDNPSLRLRDEDFTMEMFFRGNGDKTNHILIAKDGPDLNQKSFKLQVSGTNLVLQYTLDGDAAFRTWTVPLVHKAVIFNGARRHLCLQRAGDELRLFINGRVLGTLVLPTEAMFQDCSMPLNIGCDGDPTWNPTPTAGMFGRLKVDNFRLTKGLARYAVTGFQVRTTPFKTGSGA